MSYQTPSSWYRDFVTREHRHPTAKECEQAEFTVIEIQHPGYMGSQELEAWLATQCGHSAYVVSYTNTPVYIAFESAADAIAYKFVREDQWTKREDA